MRFHKRIKFVQFMKFITSKLGLIILKKNTFTRNDILLVIIKLISEIKS